MSKPQKDGLTLLVAYHRPHDAPLLMLAMPGCALLAAQLDALEWVALATSTLAFLMTGTIPLTYLADAANTQHIDTATVSSKVLTVLVALPASAALSATALTMLAVLIREARRPAEANP